MPTFPTLASGSMTVSSDLNDQAIAMYPASLNFDYVTRVIQFLGDQEQRWLVHVELFSATLQFSNVDGYDMSIIRDFFITMLGMASSSDLTHTFDITIDGQNYLYCVFDQDDLMPQEDRNMRYSFELKLKQLRKN